MPTGKLLALLAASALVASAIFVLFVLPAEFGRDPTGFGRATGLMGLAASAPAPVLAPTPTGSVAYRADAIDIPLASPDKGDGVSELEYKVRMIAGDTIVYSWAVSGLTTPEEFYFDFHGEAPPASEGAKPVVIEYQQATGDHAQGTLAATMAGVHGWYLQNQSAKPIVVHLQISGFYQLVPPGEYGNEAKIEPRKMN